MYIPCRIVYFPVFSNTYNNGSVNPDAKQGYEALTEIRDITSSYTIDGGDITFSTTLTPQATGSIWLTTIGDRKSALI